MRGCHWQSLWLVVVERKVDSTAPTFTHKRTQALHPISSRRAGDLGDMRRAPRRIAWLLLADGRDANERCRTLDDVLAAHLKFDYGIGVPS